MNASAEAADQIVRMSLNGVEVAAKITGKGAEKLCNSLFIVSLYICSSSGLCVAIMKKLRLIAQMLRLIAQILSIRV